MNDDIKAKLEIVDGRLYIIPIEEEKRDDEVVETESSDDKVTTEEPLESEDGEAEIPDNPASASNELAKKKASKAKKVVDKDDPKKDIGVYE